MSNEESSDEFGEDAVRSPIVTVPPNHLSGSGAVGADTGRILRDPTMTDPIQTVREYLDADGPGTSVIVVEKFPPTKAEVRDALDRIEAVVRAAREYRYMRNADPSDYQQNKKAETDLFEALAALDRTGETPPSEQEPQDERDE